MCQTGFLGELRKVHESDVRVETGHRMKTYDRICASIAAYCRFLL